MEHITRVEEGCTAKKPLVAEFVRIPEVSKYNLLICYCLLKKDKIIWGFVTSSSNALKFYRGGSWFQAILNLGEWWDLF